MSATAQSTADTFPALIVAAHGRQYLTEKPSGERLLCFPRGKKSVLAVGDRVMVANSGTAQGLIVECLPRDTLLFRSDPMRQKLIAANVSQIIIVTATEPGFSCDLISRCLVAADSQDMRAVIVLNKADLLDKLPDALRQLEVFRKIGVPLITVSAIGDISTLLPALYGEQSVLVGQSGMGKSTLINALIPGARAPTREISTALESGKHTTTHATRYALDDRSGIIDSPGLQEFGLSHLERESLAHAFIEFRPHLGHCRFRDCRHQHEPDCGIRAAVAAGEISSERLACYQRLYDAATH